MTACIRLATLADGPALTQIYAPAVIDRATSFEREACTEALAAGAVICIQTP
jgi:hypothetical protein